MARHKKKKAKHRKSRKRSAAAKRAYKKSGLYKYNLRRKKKGHSKHKRKYGKKKRRGSKHKRYGAMRAAARIDWGAIARAAQKSKERRARAEAGFGGPPAAKYANTPYLARLRKKHKKGGAKSGGLPAWF